jgi:hypothetical protein
VIIRVMADGQYRVDDDGVAAELNALDEQAFAAVERGDEVALRDLLRQMAEKVRSNGTRLDDGDLSSSELQVPPEDLSLEEAKRLMTDEGFIPDLPTQG